VGYIQLLDDLNTTYCGKVKCLGRLIKHFRDYHMKQRKPKSYWLGALMVYHVRRKNGLNMSQPLAVIFRDLLEAIHAQYDHLLWTSNSATPRIPDPMLGHDISWNWSRAHFETFMRRIDEGRDWATHALESEDRSEAIMSWQKVFGREFFPSQIDEMASGLAAVGLPGRAVVSGTGLVTAIKPASGMSIVTRPTTFHGQE
jgi:hypothetical protein